MLRSTRQWLGWESAERAHRSLERRLREAHLGRFKPLADFDWSWPKECDRRAIEELMSLQFLADASSVVLFGPNGVGKTMVAANLGHQAVLNGQDVRNFVRWYPPDQKIQRGSQLPLAA